MVSVLTHVAQYFYNLLGDFIELFCSQTTDSIENDVHISGKDAVWTDIAPLSHTASREVLIIKLDGISVPKCPTGDLAENPIVTY
jgi:hypothetical protein